MEQVGDCPPSECFKWLDVKPCNIANLINAIDEAISCTSRCVEWKLNWAMLLSRLNAKVRKEAALAAAIPEMFKEYDDKLNILRVRLQNWSITIPGILYNNAEKAAISGFPACRFATVANKSMGTITSVNTVDSMPKDFDIMVIVGGPWHECIMRVNNLTLCLRYFLKILGSHGSKSETATKKRYLVFSGRGGKSLSLANGKSWHGTEDARAYDFGTEAEALIYLFMEHEGAQDLLRDLNIRIVVDSFALDTVANALFTRYCMTYIYAMQEGSGLGGGESKAAGAGTLNYKYFDFKGKTIISISNAYHSTRLLYLMKNTMPLATHYGFLTWNDDEQLAGISDRRDSAGPSKLELYKEKKAQTEEEEKEEQKKRHDILIESNWTNAGAAQAYQQSFTTNFSYMVPVFKSCSGTGNKFNGDLVLFQFLQNHGLYARYTGTGDNTRLQNQGTIWETGQTSEGIVKDIANFCYPFTSLSKGPEDLAALADSQVVKSNKEVCSKVVGRNASMGRFFAIPCDSVAAAVGGSKRTLRRRKRRRRRHRRTKKRKKRK